ncbi:hypothetical protein Bca52824_014364 [Brassica carinata]|uniref:Uncharacterized protein n=1 Tax=Brassica carinata TaxID=52824 RepID=A0A8X7W0N4_BRACI|nr:hypothetical protein Bca52824_014364 [Brassica carinata]
MEDLQDVTLQYLSCADPCEAQVRQHRVLQRDAHGQMEETATRIISSAPILAGVESSLLVDTVEQRIMISSPPLRKIRQRMGLKKNVMKMKQYKTRNLIAMCIHEEGGGNIPELGQ